MRIDLKDIIETQVILDKSIHNNHHVTYESVYQELKLALFVELAELANEVRSFKFWSIKPSSSREVVLEEYADGIHFITSLCIAKQVKGDIEIADNIKLLNKHEITESFLQLFSYVDRLDNPDNIKEWYALYLTLGYGLGFTFDDITRAYFSKNQINFKRQKENY